MKTIQEMLQELSQCIVTVSGEFRFRTNWKGGGGKVPQPDLDTFDPNVPFCIENVGDVPVEIGLYNTGKNAVRSNCKISTNLKTWSDYNIVLTNDSESNDIGRILLQNKGDRVYIKADMAPFGSYVPRPYPRTKFKVFSPSDSKKIRARGNIASLNRGSNDLYKTDYLTYNPTGDSYCYYGMFEGCTSLVQAPELPATTLSSYCYSNMFSNCTSLTQAPELPATTLADYCYSHMFWYCRSLTQAPELPATALATGCYDHMLSNCTSLTQALVLPATTLAEGCYNAMFDGCTSLTQAPELPATNLAYECYYWMFSGCTSLVQAPELPATTLSSYCYRNMFSRCTSLTQAPELPATTLAEGCYYRMFYYCTKLNYVKCLATDTSATSCTSSWLYDVSYTGTFECDNKKYFTLDSSSGIPSGWTITEINPDVEKPDLDTFDPNVPFCIENVGDVQASVQYNTKNTNIRISKDYKTWNDYTTGTDIELNPKDRVYIKSDYVNDTSYNPRFVFNGDGVRLRARGNIASLIYGTNDAYINKYTSTEEYCYNCMFSGCTSLTQAPELPATTLANYCYKEMFAGCTSLTQAPELPATTLANYCYDAMFARCTSLTQAPELPATTLANSCYESTFYNCTSLTQAPELPATTLAIYCYRSMFGGCKSLIQTPELPATILHDSCYDSMFYGCTSLTQAPELPAKTLAAYCYDYMFYGCKSLIQAPELPATILHDSCYDHMFYGCTSLTQAPELPATTLLERCYDSMFYNCKKLNYIKCLATDTSATRCTTNWLSGVASTGTFECDNKKYFTLDSPNGIPVGWTITEINPDVEKPDLDVFDPNVPFCIENVGDVPVEIGLCNIGTEAVRAKRSNCKISTDLVTWSDYNILLTQDSADPNISKITLSNKGDRIYIKADANAPSTKSDYTKLTVKNQSTDTKIRARGNIASLTYGTDDLYKSKYLIIDNNSCYRSLFGGCTSLVQAPELPATNLADNCYYYMFDGCTSLTQAPELPATTLAVECYQSMFKGCTSLTRAPELPATTLKRNCYYWMFRSCKKLNYVKCLATDISAIDCTTGFLELVASTGDFYTPASTNWTTGEYGIPSGWTRHDIT